MDFLALAAQRARESSAFASCDECEPDHIALSPLVSPTLSPGFASAPSPCSLERGGVPGKPFSCAFPDCGYATARRSDLDRHARTHASGMRLPPSFRCRRAGCGIEFRFKHLLKRHSESHPPRSASSQGRFGGGGGTSRAGDEYTAELDDDGESPCGAVGDDEDDEYVSVFGPHTARGDGGDSFLVAAGDSCTRGGVAGPLIKRARLSSAETVDDEVVARAEELEARAKALSLRAHGRASAIV